jgi:hypothetical protein
MLAAPRAATDHSSSAGPNGGLYPVPAQSRLRQCLINQAAHGGIEQPGQRRRVVWREP